MLSLTNRLFSARARTSAENEWSGEKRRAAVEHGFGALSRLASTHPRPLIFACLAGRGVTGSPWLFRLPLAVREHVFVTSQGSAHGRFERAVRGGHVVQAELAAREMGVLSLGMRCGWWFSMRGRLVGLRGLSLMRVWICWRRSWLLLRWGCCRVRSVSVGRGFWLSSAGGMGLI